MKNLKSYIKVLLTIHHIFAGYNKIFLKPHRKFTNGKYVRYGLHFSAAPLY